MKIFIVEGDNRFWLELTAETVEDASALIRLKLNAKAASPSIRIYAHQNGVVAGDVGFEKTQQQHSWIGRGR